MTIHRFRVLIINLLGGMTVIGSYILEIKTHPGQVEALWGGVPIWIQPVYSANMFLAAIGYLLILNFVLFHLNSDARIGRLPLWIFDLLFLFILVPSSLWMSLTYAVAESYTFWRWFAVVITLALTGLASIGVLISLISIRPHPDTMVYKLALIGACFFVLQTAVLDAIIWDICYLK
jgi:hypothetical protein